MIVQIDRGPGFHTNFNRKRLSVFEEAIAHPLVKAMKIEFEIRDNAVDYQGKRLDSYLALYRHTTLPNIDDFWEILHEIEARIEKEKEELDKNGE